MATMLDHLMWQTKTSNTKNFCTSNYTAKIAYHDVLSEGSFALKYCMLAFFGLFCASWFSFIKIPLAQMGTRTVRSTTLVRG